MSEKETFQTAIDEQLDKWKLQIKEHSHTLDELKAKAEKLEAAAKLEYLEQIKELENKIGAVKGKMAEGEQRVEQIKTAGEEAWEEIKAGSQSAWDDLAHGVNTAWGEVKDSFESASSKMQDRVSKK